MTIKFSTGAINSMLNNTGLKSLLANGVIRCYSGAQPTDADQAPTGTLLGSITVNGGAFTEGIATNGLNFDAPVGKTLSKATAEVWKFTGAATGTLGWFRFQANAVDNGSVSTTLVRVDGQIGTATSGDLHLSTLSATSGSVQTIDVFSFTAV